MHAYASLHASLLTHPTDGLSPPPQGEYVALSKVENVLKLNPIVEYPMVYAESTRDFCVALICPNHGMLKNLATEMGIGETDVHKLCEDPKIIAEVSKRCTEVCKKSKLVAFETPKKLSLIHI